MLVKYLCFECNTEQEVNTDKRKIKCKSCGTENDFWLENEEPPQNHRITESIINQREEV